ncbi:UPF0644 protein [Lachnellula subtilissima]|uniref:UPF0644 protein n=1 Tax=Lachnellula subtilissima TaxID=602034 RepID=A0A8H8RY44_9HELO|nr:UPF0644 protein [Lachnellula subtilissima]
MPLASQFLRPSAVGFSGYKSTSSPIPRRYVRLCSRIANTDETPATIQIETPKPRSFLGRALGVVAVAFFFTTTGFLMAAVPAFKAADGFINPPTDEETLLLYTPEDDVAREIEEFIKNHPVSVELRSNPQFSESRPHLKIPESYRSHNLTGGTLHGTDKVVVPPYIWAEAGGKSLVSISYLGAALCGHPGIIHGGMLATLLDEGLARCCFGALPNKIAMTANLNINYKAPTKAGQFVVLRAKTTKVEGRKAWVEGHIETLVAPGEKPVILAEASGLFIEPKQASTMARVYPVQ